MDVKVKNKLGGAQLHHAGIAIYIYDSFLKKPSLSWALHTKWHP